MSTGTLTRIQANQQPAWDAPELLAPVLADLESRPALVDPGSCKALRDELGRVLRGDALVLQAGECAELFADSTTERVQAKAALLHRLGDCLAAGSGRPAIRVGRLAGQYAKPRSSPFEILPDGRRLPSYRGEAVNSSAPDAAARRPDPRRMLRAYDASRAALDVLDGYRPPLAAAVSSPGRHVPLYVSHEALLLDYERALVRSGGSGRRHASSAHLLWVGDRTRQPNGAHIAFVRGIANPVAVKVGPSASAADMAAIAGRLLPGHPDGGLALIVRMGAAAVAGHLPSLVDALSWRARRVLWICDPMHGNTRRTRGGHKTRVVADMLAEIRQTHQVLGQRGLRLSGLHLEVTPDPVTECLWSLDDFAASVHLPRYESPCDPRLNPAQALRVVQFTAGLISGDSEAGRPGLGCRSGGGAI